VNANPNIPAARSPVSGATAGAAKSTAPAAPATLSQESRVKPDGVGLMSPRDGATPSSPTTVCPDCEGAGFFVIGEFHPDDPRSSATYDCESCGGTGEVDEPSYEDWAAPFRRLKAGWARIEL
jgi:hypothetical protein